MAKSNSQVQWNALVNLLLYMTQKPQLLIEHADGYSQLIGQEITQACHTWGYRLFFCASAIVLFSISGVLVGVAILLWASLPAMHIHMQLLFWLVPLIPFVLALISMQILKIYMQRRVFFDLRAQLTTDVALLRGIGVPS